MRHIEMCSQYIITVPGFNFGFFSVIKHWPNHLWGSKGYNFACRFQSFLKESQGINSRQEPRGKNWSRGQGERMLADLHPGFLYSSILRSGTDHSELDPLPTISKKKIDPPPQIPTRSIWMWQFFCWGPLLSGVSSRELILATTPGHTEPSFMNWCGS